MTRVTTPQHVFLTAIDPREWDSFRITYSQGGRKILDVTEEDNVVIAETKNNRCPYSITYRLTQEETKLFVPHVKCEVQIRCHYPTGVAYASEIIHLRVSDVLNDEVL